MKSISSKVKIWLIINFIGIIFYLFFASLIWAPAGQKGLLGGPGDPITWVMLAFPFIVFFSLANVFWLVWIIFNIKKSSFWELLLIWILVVAAWIGANRYDFYHHYNGSSVQHTE
jgi:hypothetical protein